jgi:hypothetical protein
MMDMKIFSARSLVLWILLTAFACASAWAQTNTVFSSTTKWRGTLKGLGGVGIAGAISLEPSTPISMGGVSASDGKFEFSVVPGTYLVVIDIYKNTNACSQTTCAGMPSSLYVLEQVVIPEGGLTQDIQIELVELKGRVVDEAGKPVVGAVVAISGRATNSKYVNTTSTQSDKPGLERLRSTDSAPTDASGNYSFWVFQNNGDDVGYTLQLKPPRSIEI